MANEKKHFGSNNISINFNGEGSGIIRASFAETYEASDAKLLLGGLPTSLGFVSNAYIPLLYADPSDFDSTIDFFWYGNKMLRYYNSTNGNAVLPIEAVSGGSEIYDSFTVINGMPIAINADSEIIAAVVSGTAEDEANLFIGGFSFGAVLINGSWYLKYKAI